MMELKRNDASSDAPTAPELSAKSGRSDMSNVRVHAVAMIEGVL